MEIFSHGIECESDILAVRDRARVISSELGFTVPQQMQITTSIFELGKNILLYAGSGKISISLFTEDDTLTLEVIGKDKGKGIPPEQLQEVLNTKTSGKTMRGIPAMKRMMDSIDIQSDRKNGTAVRLTKKKAAPGKSLTQNIVHFFQEKFSSRKNPTISDEFELQNSSLMQTLSLYEEKNQELERTNQELTELKKELEAANNELEEQSAELQDALLSIGDHNVEIEEQNRRFAITLHHIDEGIAITDRSGEVKIVNQPFLELTGKKENELIGSDYAKWSEILGSFKTVPVDEWKETFDAIKRNEKDIYTFPLYDESYANSFQCKTVPILSEDNKIHGRVWIFT